MESGDDLYRKLRIHLDRMPVPYPETATGKEIKILKELFTPEEAEIALQLSAIPEPLKKIHRRFKHMNISEAELAEKLRAMELKGAIMATPAGSVEEKKFSKALLAVGMFEFQVNRLTSTLAENFDDYFYNEFMDSVAVTGSAVMF